MRGEGIVWWYVGVLGVCGGDVCRRNGCVCGESCFLYLGMCDVDGYMCVLGVCGGVCNVYMGVVVVCLCINRYVRVGIVSLLLGIGSFIRCIFWGCFFGMGFRLFVY